VLKFLRSFSNYDIVEPDVQHISRGAMQTIETSPRAATRQSRRRL